MKKRIIIKNGKIFDGIRAEVIENQIIEIREDLISYVGSAKLEESESEVIDAKGKLIMPGIIDCHVHIGGILGAGTIDRILEPNMQQAMVSVGQAKDLVTHGITTVCDVSMTGPYLKKLINKGELVGPRILPCGQGFAMGGGGPYVDPCGIFDTKFLRENHPWGYPCDGADNLRHGVRMRLREGCEAIKVWTTGGGLQKRRNDTDRIYTDEELQALCNEAKMAGVTVLSHCESIEGTKAALRNGIKCILHGVELDDECIDIFLNKEAWLMPTFKINLDWVEYYTDEELSRRTYIKDIDGETMQEKEYNRILLNFEKAYKKGVKIALASDTYCSAETPYGKYTLDEIRTFVNSANVGVFETLFAATRYAAEALNISNTVGTIEKGKIADMVILKKDITKNINFLKKENIEMVIKAGEVLNL